MLDFPSDLPTPQLLGEVTVESSTVSEILNIGEITDSQSFTIGSLLMQALLDLTLSSCGSGGKVFFKSFGPDSIMIKAPTGAVKRIDKKHTTNTISPKRLCSSALDPSIFSRRAGPRAACTVALAMQANAMKFFSLKLKLEPTPTNTVISIRAITPMNKHTVPK